MQNLRGQPTGWLIDLSLSKSFPSCLTRDKKNSRMLQTVTLQHSYNKTQKTSLILSPPLPSLPKRYSKEERRGETSLAIWQPPPCINPVYSHSQVALPVHSQVTSTFTLALQGLQDPAINQAPKPISCPIYAKGNPNYNNVFKQFKHNCPTIKVFFFSFLTGSRQHNHVYSVSHMIFSPD